MYVTITWTYFLLRRLREDREFIKSSRMNGRRSSSVGILNGPDITDTAQKVFTYRKSIRGLSRQYSTASGDSRFRSTISNIFGKNDDSNSRDLEIGTQVLATSDPNLLRGLSSKRVKFIKTHIDFTPSERRAWEMAQLEEKVNFLDILVNPAPVQLVEKTPLSDVHSLFSMVGIYNAYVTNIGRLVGVVGLTELKKAIDDVNNGDIEKYFEDEVTSEAVAEAETPLLERLDRIQYSSEENGHSEQNGGQIEDQKQSTLGTFV